MSEDDCRCAHRRLDTDNDDASPEAEITPPDTDDSEAFPALTEMKQDFVVHPQRDNGPTLAELIAKSNTNHTVMLLQKPLVFLKQRKKRLFTQKMMRAMQQLPTIPYLDTGEPVIKVYNTEVS